MKPAPFVVSTAIVVGALASTVHLAIDSEPFAPAAAALLAAGALVFAVVTVAGLLLSRGRWALRLALSLVAAQIALGLVIELGPWAFVALGANLAALAGLTGPWLSGWLRRRPAAGGPGASVVLLLLASLALLPGVAVAAPGDPGWQHGALAALGVAGAWGYSRAAGWGLWALRLAVLPLAAAAVPVSPVAGAAYLTAHAATVTVLAWFPESRRAIHPLLDRVYGPRSARPLGPGAEDAG